jgi:hypothetical protein
VVLGTRRRLLAALVTAAAAFALAVTATGRGCSGSGSPEGAAREFVGAARSGDRQAVWALLGPATRRRLEDAALAATEKVGGTRRYDALDMLDVAASDGPPVDVVLRERRGGQAIVDLLGAAGLKDTLTLVEVGQTWRVELDVE